MYSTGKGKSVEVLGYWFAAIGLASPLALSHLLDRVLKEELKKKLFLYVFGDENQNISQRVMLFNSILTAALGAGVMQRALRLLAIGFVSIFFVYSLQYIFNRGQFNDVTYPFLSEVLSLRPLAIYTFISFACVDAISFFQTTTFSRLAAYCKNPVEVLFLAFADVVVSLFLVIVFLPVFIFWSYALANSPHDVSVKVVILETLQSQELTIADVISLVAPRISEPTEEVKSEAEEAKTLSGAGWTYTNPRVFVGAADSEVSIQTAVDGSVPSAGRTLLFTKGEFSPAESASFISDILQATPGISKVRVVESEGDMFGNAAYNLTVEGVSQYSGLSFLGSYSSIMGGVNFFGGDLYEAVSFGSKTYDENAIILTGLLANVFDKADGKIVLKCENKPVVTIDRSDFLRIPEHECKKAFATSGWGASGIASLLSYNLKNNLSVPVLPTAISSIFLTILIYVSIIAWLLIPYIRKFVEEYTTDGAKLLTDNIFTVSFSLIALVSAPFLFYFLG